MQRTIQKKPNYASHYLVLKDLIDGIDIRQHSDIIYYLSSRVENIKYDLVKKGLLFDEDAIAFSNYSSYKPYILIRTKDNLILAEKLLKQFGTNKVMQFLENCIFKTNETSHCSD